MAEIAQRMLSELDEAGAQYVTTLINTAFPPSGSQSEVQDLAAALQSLIKSDFAVMSVYTKLPEQWSASREVSAEIAEFEVKHLQYQQVQRLWRNMHVLGPPFDIRLPLFRARFRPAAGLRC